jgi:sulfotransferase
MKQDIFFMSGFPRAGSTLLMQILGQNPRFHPTPTSGLISSVLMTRNNWRSENHLAVPEDHVYPRIKSMLRGMMYGYYENEIKAGQIPIDKNRAWVNNMDLLDELLDTRVRFIYPIRHVVDCLISFEKIRRRSQINIDPHKNKIKAMTTIGRAENYLADDDVMGMPIVGLREIMDRKDYDRLLLVPFDDLLRYPEATVKRLYYQMQIDYYPHDFNNIKQITTEYDSMHFSAPYTLHSIKEGGIQLPNDRDLTIFNENVINEIENQKYRDITDFINANTGVF